MVTVCIYIAIGHPEFYQDESIGETLRNDPHTCVETPVNNGKKQVNGFELAMRGAVIRSCTS